MGFFSSLNKVMNAANQIMDMVDDLSSNASQVSENITNVPTLNLASGYHEVSISDFASDQNGEDVEYSVSIKINDAFVDDDCGAAEVSMYCPYAPNGEYGADGDDLLYFAIINDQTIYSAIEEFKNTGKISNAYECMALDGKYLCKAKMNYGDNIVYLYGIDRCGGYWENSALCMVYKKMFLGTETEKTIMKMMDDIVESYAETIVC